MKKLIFSHIHVKILSCLLVTLSAMFITACGDNGPSQEPGEEKDMTPRTILVYMVGNNNLSSYAKPDLDEMLLAASAGDLGRSRLIIYNHTRTAGPALREITPAGEMVTLVEYDTDDLSVSSRRMETVIADMKRLAPARKYGMIFWGHGTGYVQDGIEDIPAISTLSYGGENINGTSQWMNTTTLASVLAGKNFDWLYFDCCFMMGVEVVYQLRGVTDHIIGSATEIPANGTRYDLILKHLTPADSDIEAAAKATFDYYDSLAGTSRTCTMSVVSTAGIEALARVMKEVWRQAPSSLTGYSPQPYQTPDDHRRYKWSYYDLKHYARALAEGNPQLLSDIDNAFDLTVTAAYATPMLWNEVQLLNHSGLSTLIIENDSDPQLDQFGYRELSWWNDVVRQRFDKPL